MGDTRLAFAATIAIDRIFAGGMERLPGNSGGILDPGFFRCSVAARGVPLLDDGPARLAQSGVDLVQLGLAFRLDAEMIQARLFAARGDREIDAWIIQHPFGVVGLDHRRLRCEQRGVEADGPVKVRNLHMDVHAFHGVTLLIPPEAERSRCGSSWLRSSSARYSGSAVP